MTEIPCVPDGESDWTQRTALGGSDYLLRFRWSQRAGTWSLTLSDADGAPIVSGLALVCGVRLLERVADPRRPPGELLALDVSGLNDADPAWSDLGGRFALVYLEPEELG